MVMMRSWCVASSVASSNLEMVIMAPVICLKTRSRSVTAVQWKRSEPTSLASPQGHQRSIAFERVRSRIYVRRGTTSNRFVSAKSFQQLDELALPGIRVGKFMPLAGINRFLLYYELLQIKTLYILTTHLQPPLPTFFFAFHQTTRGNTGRYRFPFIYSMRIKDIGWTESKREDKGKPGQMT